MAKRIETAIFHRGDAEARSKAKPLKHGGTEEGEEKSEEHNNRREKAKAKP